MSCNNDYMVSIQMRFFLSGILWDGPEHSEGIVTNIISNSNVKLIAMLIINVM